MKLLITGGNGLVGKALQEQLKLSDYTIYIPSSKECNLEDFYKTFSYINKRR